MNIVGIGLIVYGLIHLVLNEPVTRLKRLLKPWWREDDNPVHDAILQDLLRAIVYVGGVVSFEIGCRLTDVISLELYQRVTFYLVMGVLTLFIRWLSYRIPSKLRTERNS